MLALYQHDYSFYELLEYSIQVERISANAMFLFKNQIL
jgi:hypothetical protein